MITENKPGLIVILEEAYKQNTVYRPWPKEKKIKSVGSPVERRFEVISAKTRISDLSSGQQAPGPARRGVRAVGPPGLFRLV